MIIPVYSSYDDFLSKNSKMINTNTDINSNISIEESGIGISQDTSKEEDKEVNNSKYKCKITKERFNIILKSVSDCADKLKTLEVVLRDIDDENNLMKLCLGISSLSTYSIKVLSILLELSDLNEKDLQADLILNKALLLIKRVNSLTFNTFANSLASKYNKENGIDDGSDEIKPFNNNSSRDKEEKGFNNSKSNNRRGLGVSKEEEIKSENKGEIVDEFLLSTRGEENLLKCVGANTTDFISQVNKEKEGQLKDNSVYNSTLSSNYFNNDTSVKGGFNVEDNIEDNRDKNSLLDLVLANHPFSDYLNNKEGIYARFLFPIKDEEGEDLNHDDECLYWKEKGFSLINKINSNVIKDEDFGEESRELMLHGMPPQFDLDAFLRRESRKDIEIDLDNVAYPSMVDLERKKASSKGGLSNFTIK